MANASINLGNGNWSVKESKLLGSRPIKDKIAPIEFDVTRASTATRVNKQGLIETVNSNIARIDYSNNAKGALLLEPQSTNLINYSELFSDASWTKQSGIIPTYNTMETLSPDGTYNATKFIGDGAAGVYKAGNTVSGAIARTVYLKSVTGTTTAIFKDPNAGGAGVVNLTITNEWKRFELIGSNGSSSQGLWIDNITSDGLYMWGAQLEQNSYATSYIPTLTGTAQTRVAETCGGAGDASSINSEEGVLYAETATLANDGIRQISLSSGSNSNRVAISYNTNGRLDANVISGGGFQAIFNYTGVVNPNTQNKIALKYKLNDFALWVNGVEVANDSSGITPIGLSVLNLSSAGIASEIFYGNTKDLRVYNTALTDSELQALTTL